MTVELATHDSLGGPDTIDQLVDVHAGGDPHVVHHVEQVLGGGHARGTAVAAVGAAAEPADGAVKFQCVVGAKYPHCGVGRCDGHVAAVMEMQADVVNLRPHFLDPVDTLLDLGRRAMAHGVAHGCAAHIDSDLVPHAVLTLQHGH